MPSSTGCGSSPTRSIAFPLWALDLYVWHLPVLYQAALRHPGVHALQHAMFLGLGINMWMCLFGPLPMPQWFGNLGRLIYIVAVRLTGTVLGNIFLWSGTVFYPFYLHGDAVYNISPLADQNIAGAIMMVEESLLTLGLFCWLFLRAASEGEERQNLLDCARPTASSSARSGPRGRSRPGRGDELRGASKPHGRDPAEHEPLEAPSGARRSRRGATLRHVRRLRDGGRLGGDGLQELAADPPLRLADAAADAAADDRGDVRRRARLDGGDQRLGRRARAHRPCAPPTSRASSPVAALRAPSHAAARAERARTQRRACECTAPGQPRVASR